MHLFSVVFIIKTDEHLVVIINSMCTIHHMIMRMTSISNNTSIIYLYISIFFFVKTFAPFFLLAKMYLVILVKYTVVFYYIYGIWKIPLSKATYISALKSLSVNTL